MAHPSDAPAGVVAPDSWLLLAADGSEAAVLASSPLTITAFFASWVALGMAPALGLARRGHDRNTMVAIGAGLGPLMLMVASDAVRRAERAAHPLVVRPGADLGGGLHLLVLVPALPEEARSLVPTVEAMRPDIASFTVARVVTYESIEGVLDHEAITELSELLRVASDLLGVEGAGIELHPGTTETVVNRFEERFPRTLVLFAVEDTTTDASLQDRR